MDAAESKFHEVLVVVSPREPFSGFWCAQQHWPSGKTKRVVLASELDEIRADEERKFLAVEPIRTFSDAEAAALAKSEGGRFSKAALKAATPVEPPKRRT